jgi:Bacterial Ig domain/Bacterial cadherin-like domain
VQYARRSQRRHGVDTLIVEVNDGGASGAGGPKTARTVLLITVTPVNDVPRVTAAATQATAKQGVTTALPALAVADADGPRVMLTVTVSAASGSVSLLAGTDLGGLQFPVQPGGEPPVLLAAGTSNSSAAQQQLVLRGTQAVLTSALSRLVYTSAAAHSGDDAVTVLVQDDSSNSSSSSSNSSSGDAPDSSTVILVTVQPERAPPLTVVMERSLQCAEGDAAAAFPVAVARAGGGQLQPLIVLNVTLTASAGVLSIEGAVNARQVQLVTADTGAKVTLLGLAADVNDVLARVVYTPVQHWNSVAHGAAVFTVTAAVADSSRSSSSSSSSADPTAAVAAAVTSSMALITVTAVNDAPQLSAPQRVSGLENTAVSIAGVAVSDVDMSETPGAVGQLTLSFSHGTVTLGRSPGLYVLQNSGSLLQCTGTLEVLNTALQGLSYRSAPQWSGTDSLEIAVSDLGNSGSGGALTAQRSVAIAIAAVNDAPVIQLPTAGGPVRVREDEPTALHGLAVTDADDSTLAVTVSAEYGTVSVPPLQLMLAEVQLSSVRGSGTQQLQLAGSTAALDTALAALVYTSASNWHSGLPGAGLDTVTVTATDRPDDKGTPVAAAFTVEVTAVNDPPEVLVSQQALTVAEGAPLLLTAVSLQDVDADESGDAVLELSLTVSKGELAFGSTAGLYVLTATADQQQQQSQQKLAARGSLVQLNAALAAIVYTSTQRDWHGADTLTVIVNDLGNSGEGGAQQATATVTITVTAVNDAPTVTCPTAVTLMDEDSELQLSFLAVADPDSRTVTVNITAVFGVLHSATEPSPHLAVAPWPVPADGTANLQLRGSVTDVNAALQAVSFVPLQDYAGSAEVRVTAVDDSSSAAAAVASQCVAALYVRPVNDAPIIHYSSSIIAAAGDTSSALMCMEDQPLALTGLSLSDVDSDSPPELCGDAPNSAAAANMLTLTVQAQHGTLAVTSLLGQYMVAGSSAAAAAATLSMQGSLSSLNEALATLVYQPAAQYTGADTVTLEVSDDGNCGSGGSATAVRELSITVLAVDDVPAITINGNAVPLQLDAVAAAATALVLTTDEHSSLLLPAVTVSDVDAVGASLVRVTLAAANGALRFGAAAGLREVRLLSGTTTAGGSVIELEGLPSDLNSALAGLQFEPASYGLWQYVVGANTPVLAPTDPQLAAVLIAAASSSSANSAAGTGAAAATAFAVLHISVVAVNEQPVIAAPQSLAAVSGEAVAVYNVTVSDADFVVAAAESSTGWLSVTAGTTAGGALSVDYGTALRYGVRDSDTSTTGVSLQGTPEQLNAVLSTLVYTGSGTTTADSITLHVTDNGFSGSGGALTDTATITVTVSPPAQRQLLIDSDSSALVAAAATSTVELQEDTAVQLIGLDSVLTQSDAPLSDTTEVTVHIATQSGGLLLGPAAAAVTASQQQQLRSLSGSSSSANTAVVHTITASGDAVIGSPVQEVRSISTSVPWQYEVQALDVSSTSSFLTAVNVELSLTRGGVTATTSASLLSESDSAQELTAALQSMENVGNVRVTRQESVGAAQVHYLITFLSAGGQVSAMLMSCCHIVADVVVTKHV